jgi:hypothetical protein
VMVVVAVVAVVTVVTVGGGGGGVVTWTMVGVAAEAPRCVQRNGVGSGWTAARFDGNNEIITTNSDNPKVAPSSSLISATVAFCCLANSRSSA